MKIAQRFETDLHFLMIVQKDDVAFWRQIIQRSTVAPRSTPLNEAHTFESHHTLAT